MRACATADAADNRAWEGWGRLRVEDTMNWPTELHRLLGRISLNAALAAVLGLSATASALPVAPGDTICGWNTIPLPGNTLSLLPASVPPAIDPSGPCSCCVSGDAKFGLGVFGTADNTGAFVFYSLATIPDLPLFGETWVLDPTQIVATIFLTPDPGIPSFANSCWVEDDCLTIPANPALIGVTVYMQAAAPVDPDWALSNRVDLLLGTQF